MGLSEVQPLTATLVHDISDPSKPETWKWMFSLTWPDQGSAVPKDHEVIRQEWTSRAKKLAEPFRSAYLGLGFRCSYLV